MKIIRINKKVEIDDGLYNNEFRYICVDDENGEVLEDAQGYGFKTYSAAAKSYWYKHKGGKEKIDKSKLFFKRHPEIQCFVDKIYENNFKEFARGEWTINDLRKAVLKEFDVEIPSYVRI